MISDSHKNFYQAKSFCKAANSNLTSVTSVEENTYIARICGYQSCWIGLEEVMEGEWV